MTDVEYPGMRVDLKSYVERLASVEYQDAYWRRGLTEDGDDLNETINEFFDVFDPATPIGQVVKTRGEREALKVLADAITNAINTVGRESSDAALLGSPIWQDVVAAAKAAQLELRI